MFGVDSSELLLIVLIAVVVIGPKDLPRMMRSIGKWTGKARGMASQFRLGVDQMVRDSEIADLEKKWREQNEAIMRAHPLAPDPVPVPAPAGEATDSNWGLPPEPEGPLTGPVPLGKIARPAPVPPLTATPAAVSSRARAGDVSLAKAETQSARPDLDKRVSAPEPLKPGRVMPRSAGGGAERP